MGKGPVDQQPRYRQVDLARAGGISPQQVRTDESHGVLPPVARTTGGHRRYDAGHLLALLAYRALIPGHGALAARQVMRALHAGDQRAALEILDASHSNLHHQRCALRAISAALLEIAGELVAGARAEDHMLIGDVAAALGVATSTLRTWDAAGLVRPTRTTPGGYRTYSPADVRDARITHQLRLAGYHRAQVHHVLTPLRDAGEVSEVHRAIARRHGTIERRARSMITGAAALDRYLNHANTPTTAKQRLP